MRTGFRYYAYQCRKKDHQCCVVADPLVNFNILESYPEDKQHSECPCEDDRKVSLYYMVPQMLLYKVVRSKDQYYQDDDAQAGKQDIHPLLVKKIDGCGVFVMMGMRVVVMTVVMGA